MTTSAFKFAAQRGTEKCNPQRARKARRRSHSPDALAVVLSKYKEEWKPNAQGFLFVTRNGRPPSSNKVVEYQLWPILDALNIPRCGLHAFRHSVASFIVDAGYAPEVAQQQLRHSNARTTLGYIHLRGGITEQAMTDVANSLKLDVIQGREVSIFNRLEVSGRGFDSHRRSDMTSPNYQEQIVYNFFTGA